MWEQKTPVHTENNYRNTLARLDLSKIYRFYFPTKKKKKILEKNTFFLHKSIDARLAVSHRRSHPASTSHVLYGIAYNDDTLLRTSRQPAQYGSDHFSISSSLQNI